MRHIHRQILYILGLTLKSPTILLIVLTLFQNDFYEKYIIINRYVKLVNIYIDKCLSIYSYILNKNNDSVMVSI